MPSERRSSTNFQGRQKSCSECAKAKRRCDLRLPSCVRCSRQGLACVYPAQSSMGATPAFQDLLGDTPQPTMLNDEGLFAFDAACPSLVAAPGADAGLLDFDLSTGADALDALSAMVEQAEPADSGIAAIKRYYVPKKQWSASNFSSFAWSRLGYSIEQMKLVPSQFVLENKTPWLHPLLYEDSMPRCLQDAHAVCALYTVRNEANMTAVARQTMSRLDELLDSPSPTDSLPELLARAQALMLYHLMLTFSDNLRYTRYFDTLDRELEVAGKQIHDLLLHEIEPQGPMQLYPCTTARMEWKAFISRESARRTMLGLFGMLAMCRLMCGKYHSCKDIQLNSRVTMSALLWQAESAFDFAVTWNERNHHVVDNLDYTRLLETARPEEIDVFGRTLLSSMIGIDDMKGWFHTRGGKF